MITREFALQAIAQENVEGRKWAEVNFSDEQTSLITEDVVLLTYKVSSRWNQEKDFLSAFASTLYVKQSDSWKVVFHQQSPVMK